MPGMVYSVMVNHAQKINTFQRTDLNQFELFEVGGLNGQNYYSTQAFTQ